MPDVTVGGVRVAYEVRGEGPTIVLVCGTGQTAAMWHALGTVDGLVGAGSFPPALVREAASRMPRGEFVEIAGSAHVSLDPVHNEQIRAAIADFLVRHAPAV